MNRYLEIFNVSRSFGNLRVSRGYCVTSQIQTLVREVGDCGRDLLRAESEGNRTVAGDCDEEFSRLGA
jgi:hypothetical protein